MNGPHWTPERDKIAVELWSIKGFSAQQIAERLGGVTRSAVLGRLFRMGQVGKGSRVRAAPSAPSTARRPAPKPAPKLIAARKASLKLAGQGAVFQEAEPRQPTVVIPFRDEPTLGAKPWLDRSPFECTWIVAGEGADALCCAAPIHGRGWCLGHYKRGLQPSSPNKRAVEPLQARVTARFA